MLGKGQEGVGGGVDAEGVGLFGISWSSQICCFIVCLGTLTNVYVSTFGLPLSLEHCGFASCLFHASAQQRRF